MIDTPARAPLRYRSGSGNSFRRVPRMSQRSLVLVEKAWSQYFESGELDLKTVRPEVANSWQRCRNLKVDPFDETPGSVNQLELHERLYAKQRLMKIARPFMENLYNFVKGSGDRKSTRLNSSHYN